MKTRKKLTLHSVEVGIISLEGDLLLQTKKLEVSDTGWINRMQTIHSVGVNKLLFFLNENGFDSFDSACDQIEKSYPIFKKFFKSVGVAHTDEVKRTFEVMQHTLFRAFVAIKSK